MKLLREKDIKSSNQVDEIRVGLEENFDFNLALCEPHLVSYEENKDALIESPCVEHSSNRVLCLILNVMKLYMKILPGQVAQSRFEILRVFDEFIFWESGTVVFDALSSLNNLDQEVLNSILQMLQISSDKSSKW
jgi:hypothetical protein